MISYVRNPVRFDPCCSRFGAVSTTRGQNLRYRRQPHAFTTKLRFQHMRAYDPYERWCYEAKCMYPVRHYKWRIL